MIDDTPDLFDRAVSAEPRPVSVKRARASLVEIPFMQRPTCTIKEACKAAGLGRTKLYELIKNGTLETSTVGRRRLVLVPSLLKSIRFRDTAD
jgi:excisionase family DNA binding protein